MAFCMMIHKMDKACSFKHVRPESDVVSRSLLSPVSQFPSSSLQGQLTLPVPGVFVYIVCSYTNKSSLHSLALFQRLTVPLLCTLHFGSDDTPQGHPTPYVKTGQRLSLGSLTRPAEILCIIRLFVYCY